MVESVFPEVVSRIAVVCSTQTWKYLDILHCGNGVETSTFKAEFRLQPDPKAECRQERSEAGVAGTCKGLLPLTQRLGYVAQKISDSDVGTFVNLR